MLRIGQSTDIHPLVKGRPLIIGGIKIESPVGCLGHSDGDALVHAMAESILGALALGDLGRHFSDKDPAFKDIDSTLLLARVVHIMEEKGYHLVNMDTLVIIETPKLAPYIPKMKEKLAPILKISLDCLNIKATRGEKLGFIGQGQGLLAQAVCLLERDAHVSA